MTDKTLPKSIDSTLDLLAKADYIADRSLATVLYLALRMGRPLFVEGEAGVGKTEIAKVLATTLGRRLIRLQCYEGLDVSAAVYEWNYGAQMIAIRLAEAEGEGDRTRIEHDVFSERFLIKRPLLQALEPDPSGPPVLLIDEIDRTDEAFEAFLLEVLADFQVTVPELGTMKAAHPPIVVVTSNRTREVHDALKRRCLYHWVGYPNAERELKILRAKVPGIAKKLSEQVVAFVQALRKEDLFKSPGVAETLDWAGALTELRQLGRVVVETQTAEDVTKLSADLDARLANFRISEQRLKDLLQHRTGKLSEVLEVEQQITRVRGEIEQMESQRKGLTHRVDYVGIAVKVTESAVGPASSSALGDAARNGWRNLVGGMTGFAEFVLTVGPSLIFWGVLVVVPAGFAWRRWGRRGN